MASAPEHDEYMVEEPRGWRGLSRLQRELIYLAAELLCGMVLVPLLVWVAGNRVLGGYVSGSNQHAGPGALLADFFSGLVNGSAAFWLVALGPAILVALVRAGIYLLRATRPGRDEAPY
jgi:hypothetical protein